MTRSGPIVVVAHPPPARPLMVFDGACSFCKRWIDRWRSLTGERIDCEPYQTAAARFGEIPVSAFQQAVHLIEPGGRVTRGALAMVRSLAVAGRGHGLLWLYERLPGFGLVAELLYRFVARHRSGLDRVERFFVRPARPKQI